MGLPDFHRSGSWLFPEFESLKQYEKSTHQLSAPQTLKLFAKVFKEVHPSSKYGVQRETYWAIQVITELIRLHCIRTRDHRSANVLAELLGMLTMRARARFAKGEDHVFPPTYLGSVVKFFRYDPWIHEETEFEKEKMAGPGEPSLLHLYGEIMVRKVELKQMEEDDISQMPGISRVIQLSAIKQIKEELKVFESANVKAEAAYKHNMEGDTNKELPKVFDQLIGKKRPISEVDADDRNTTGPLELASKRRKLEDAVYGDAPGTDTDKTVKKVHSSVKESSTISSSRKRRASGIAEGDENPEDRAKRIRNEEARILMPPPPKPKPFSSATSGSRPNATLPDTAPRAKAYPDLTEIIKQRRLYRPEAAFLLSFEEDLSWEGVFKKGRSCRIGEAIISSRLESVAEKVIEQSYFRFLYRDHTADKRNTDQAFQDGMFIGLKIPPAENTEEKKPVDCDPCIFQERVNVARRRIIRFHRCREKSKRRAGEQIRRVEQVNL